MRILMFESAGGSLNLRKRLLIFFSFFVLATLLLSGRLAWVQLVRAEKYGNLAWEQWTRGVPARSPRGTIYDRQGRVLAGNVAGETIVAYPPQIDDAEGTARQLAEVLGIEYEKILKQITSNLSSIFIRRQLDREIALQVRKLALPGIGFIQESKRYYPNDNLLSQVLGFVGVDQGWSGLEIRYEEILRGRDGRMVFQTDGRRRRIPQGGLRLSPPKDGADLVLTIDETIQFILERELDRGMLEHEPLQALAIAADPRTGEILAMAGKPDFSPDNFAAYPEANWKISPIGKSFEPGSTFKLVTLAAAIDQNVFDMTEGFFCRGCLNVAGYDIRCWTYARGGHGSLIFLETVLLSCNPGFMTLGQRLGAETLFHYIKGFGFGVRTGIDLPGESSGILFPLERVGPIELATSSFGQGISTTPLQQVMAVAAMVNGGYLMEPYVVKEIRDVDGNVLKKREPEVVRQVISAQTSEELKYIMEQVVIDGSGRNAAVSGYRIGGKTGTAQKVGADGRYIVGEFIVSFIGFFPVEDPQVVIYVAVDGARRGPQWGGQISAPIFQRIARDVINYLGIPPCVEEDTQLTRQLVRVPDLTGLTLTEAGLTVDAAGLIIKPVGEGRKIKEQTPMAGAQVPLQTEVMVYLGSKRGEVQLPDLSGRTMRESAKILNWLGLKMKGYGSGTVIRQEPLPLEYIPVGSTVVLEFNLRD